MGLYENVLAKLKERQKIYLASLSGGSFQSFEEYKLCVGKLKGIDEAEMIVREMYRNMFEGGN